MGKVSSLLAAGAVAGLLAAGVPTGPAASAVNVPNVTEYTSSGPCRDVLFVGVRGSGQTSSDGPLGMGDEVGGVFNEYTTWLHGRTIEYLSVDYTAAPVTLSTPLDIPGYLDSVEVGEKLVATNLTVRHENCPNERFVLVGYSQGALAIDLALREMDRQSDLGALSSIDAAFLIANPLRLPKDGRVNHLGTAQDRKSKGGIGQKAYPYKDTPRTYASKVYDFCDKGDVVCDWGKYPESLLESVVEVHTSHYKTLTFAAEAAKVISRQSIAFPVAVADALSLPAERTLTLNGDLGTDFTHQLELTDDSSAPYYWSVAEGSSLPAGVYLTRDGMLSGTAPAAGTSVALWVTPGDGKKRGSKTEPQHSPLNVVWASTPMDPPELPFAGGGSPQEFDVSIGDFGTVPPLRLGPDGRVHLCFAGSPDQWRTFTRSGEQSSGPDGECFVAQDKTGVIYSTDRLADAWVRAELDGTSLWTSTELQYVWPLADGSMLGLSTGFRGTLGHASPSGTFDPLPQGSQYNGGPQLQIRPGSDAVAVFGSNDFNNTLRMFDPQSWLYEYSPRVRDARVLALGPGARAITAEFSSDCRLLTVMGHARAAAIWDSAIPIEQTSTYCNPASMFVQAAGDFAWVVVPVFRDDHSISSLRLFQFDYEGNGDYEGNWVEGPSVDLTPGMIASGARTVGDESGALIVRVIQRGPCDYNQLANCDRVHIYSAGPDLSWTRLDSVIPTSPDGSISGLDLVPGFGQLWMTYDLRERGSTVDHRIRSVLGPFEGATEEIMSYLPTS